MKMLSSAFLAAALASTAFAQYGPSRRDLIDLDLCLDVDVLGILDINVGLDLDILGKGKKTPCSKHKCGFAPWVPARGLVDVDLCVDVDLLGLVEVDLAAHLGLLDSGRKHVPCKKSTACPPPGGHHPHPSKPVTSSHPPTHKPTTTKKPSTTTKKPNGGSSPTCKPTKTVTRIHTVTVTATPSHGPKPPHCVPHMHKRSLIDTDLCLDLNIGGLIDLDLALDLDILGKGHKVQCGSGCGIPTWVPAHGLVDVDLCVDIKLLGLVSVDLAAHLGLLDHGLKRSPCIKKQKCPCPFKPGHPKRSEIARAL